MNRRTFLSSGLTSAVASAVPQNPVSTSDTSPKILNEHPGMKYRLAKKAGIYLSALCNGGLVSVESVVSYMIDSGVNLVHASEVYQNGQSIATYRKVLKDMRDKVYIAIKDDFGDMDTVLKSLGTDYVDFLVFNRHTPTEVNDPALRETFEKFQQAGKVRWAGLACHSRVKETVTAAINTGWMSLISPAMNQPAFESMQQEIRLAEEKGVALMPMKTMNGIAGMGLQTAFVKKLMANSGITCIVRSFGSYDMFDAYLKAVNESLTVSEDKALYRYAQSSRSRNCMACGECQAACPERIDVPSIMRAKYYYNDQCGDHELAAATYRELENTGSIACGGCDKCERACPNGIPIRQRLETARQFFAA